MFVWILWLAIFAAVAWMWQKKKLSLFKEQGVKHLPTIPFVGNLLPTFLSTEHFSETVDKPYRAFPNERLFGSYEFLKPVVHPRDPELIRLIGVKDFEHFADHSHIGNESDPVFSKSLFGLRGERWRDMRSTLSPAFTASKLKKMVPLIMESNEDMMSTLQEEIMNSSNKCMDIDTHDLLTRYTNDVIATCAFGLKTNSLKEKNNQFYQMGKKLTTITRMAFIKLIFGSSFPLLRKLTNFTIFDSKAINFLHNIVLNAMNMRDKNKAFRPDMIQILLEVKKGTLKNENTYEKDNAGFAAVEESAIGKNNTKYTWTDDYLVAQALLFFFAGFDTVSTCMTYLLLELAINPDIQEKLREEIEEHYKRNNGKLDYEKVNEMKYLDMVISETLRKWPPAQGLDRLCIKDYNMGKPNEKSENDFIMKKGTSLNIPIWSLHRDPDNFPNPTKFDPERFSDENKHNVKPFTYLPFGVGPRNCIGSRFALTEVKVMVFELIRRFELSPAPQTVLPPRFDLKSAFSPRLEGGAWLRYTLRQSV